MNEISLSVGDYQKHTLVHTHGPLITFHTLSNASCVFVALCPEGRGEGLMVYM